MLVWQPRWRHHPRPIIVVANFSDFASAPGPIPYPTGRDAPAGKKWVEITQGRDVNPDLVGREAIFPWEAKVYTLANV